MPGSPSPACRSLEGGGENCAGRPCDPGRRVSRRQEGSGGRAGKEDAETVVAGMFPEGTGPSVGGVREEACARRLARESRVQRPASSAPRGFL